MLTPPIDGLLAEDPIGADASRMALNMRVPAALFGDADRLDSRIAFHRLNALGAVDADAEAAFGRAVYSSSCVRPSSEPPT